jgi:hypothetical protein
VYGDTLRRGGADSLSAPRYQHHYPDPNRGCLQKDLRNYTHKVIDVAWPEQQEGNIPRGNVLTVVNLATPCN